METKDQLKDEYEITYKDCGYLEDVAWKKRYACFHSNEFFWCVGCPRKEGVHEEETGEGGTDVN